jgi:hypothetical protein
VRLDGQLIVNDIAPMLVATLDGCGVGYLPLDLVQPYIDKGNLVQLLSDWTPPAVAKHLLVQSKKVRALVRNREKGAKWADQGVELVEGDWNDSAAIERALKGVEGAESQYRSRLRTHG